MRPSNTPDDTGVKRDRDIVSKTTPVEHRARNIGIGTFGRRTVLKAIGVSAIPLAAGTVSASEPGYGVGGYGDSPYGGTEESDDGSGSRRSENENVRQWLDDPEDDGESTDEDDGESTDGDDGESTDGDDGDDEGDDSSGSRQRENDSVRGWLATQD